MKHGFIKVAAGAPKVRVADVMHNAQQIISLVHEADALGVKVLVLPELCITGYTCGDLFLQDTLLDGAEMALVHILSETADTDVLCAVGLPLRAGGRLFNCAALLHRGEIVAVIPKTNLPTYAEFAEMRWFTGADETPLPFPLPLRLRRPDGSILPATLEPALIECENLPELKIGVELCEDIFVPDPPSRRLAQAGATLILNLSASTELVGKTVYRRELIKQQSARLICGYVYANAGIGESSTDIVYSGHRIIADNDCLLADSHFNTGLLVSEIDVRALAHERRRMSTYARNAVYGDKPEKMPARRSVRFDGIETQLTRPIPRNPFLPADSSGRRECFEDILTIQSTGLKQRIEFMGIQHPVVGVSGGLDSTLAMLVTVRAMDALGIPRENLLAVTMPGFGTTARTLENAKALAKCLGAQLRCVDISESVLRHFADIGHDVDAHDLVFENAQARSRTLLLMDLANDCGGLVVGTGDLSELALGWTTYNGDHMSMYAVNSGVPKTVVRLLVQYIADNCGDDRLREVLTDILATPVSPELLPAEDGRITQKTEDLVGPYELHDFFLWHLIRQGSTPDKVLRLAKLAFDGIYDGEYIKKWLKVFLQRFFSQQFKRSCLPDGVQVFSLSLSPRGSWHMPSDAVVKCWLDASE